MNKTIWAIAFVVLACGVSFAITNASVTEYDQNKFTGTLTAGNITTEGGNITEMDVGTNASTEKWAGMYGNVTGQLVLSEAANTPYMYSWTYSTSAGGEVCASTEPDYVWADIATLAAGTIDTIWGFVTTDADSETLTMVETGNVDINGVSVDSVAVTTEGTSVWQTVALGNGVDADKTDIAFCVNITDAGSAFNGDGANFQLMVPTNEAALSTEQYFFYVELI